jgi:hypothetical protein
VKHLQLQGGQLALQLQHLLLALCEQLQQLLALLIGAALGSSLQGVVDGWRRQRFIENDQQLAQSLHAAIQWIEQALQLTLPALQTIVLTVRRHGFNHRNQTRAQLVERLQHLFNVESKAITIRTALLAFSAQPLEAVSQETLRTCESLLVSWPELLKVQAPGHEASP